MYKSLIARKLDIEDEDAFFMILELSTFLVSYFGRKVITKIWRCFSFVSIWVISSFKLEKGDNIKLSRAGFLYK